MNNPIRSRQTLFGLLAAALVFQTAIAGGVRYRDEIFADYQRLANVQYGHAGTTTLYLDVYTGTGDTVKNRPLAVFIHAGGFQTGDKASTYARIVCSALAKRGYVAASIDYRLASSLSGDTAYFEAMLRALQDAKAAVRFFRKNGSLYGVDTSHVFVVGSSAGAITALHLAYLDSAEVPAYVNWDSVGNSFEGLSGNAGYSSRVQAVVACWGAIGDTAWIQRNGPPLYCVHGTSDSTIYYNLIPAYGPFLYSSKYIIMAAQEKGIQNGLRLFIGAGHELNGDTTKEDSAVTDFSAWLYTILEPGTSPVQEVSSSLPEAAALFQNYPNPFNPTTVVSYQLSVASNVKLVVYDILGREVAVLVNERKSAGSYEVTFDAGGLASGVYFYRLTAGSFTQTRKMAVMK